MQYYQAIFRIVIVSDGTGSLCLNLAYVAICAEFVFPLVWWGQFAVQLD